MHPTVAIHGIVPPTACSSIRTLDSEIRAEMSAIYHERAVALLPRLKALASKGITSMLVELPGDEACVSFGGLAVLGGISLHALPGEVVGVIGPNGAGNTNLFTVVRGFVAPTSGTITANNRRIDRHQAHHRVQMGIARTLQGVSL